MTVKELVTSDVKSCSPETDLAMAAKIMWDYDCGVVPVVNDQRNVIGMITDRDICIAAATRSTSPADIQVGDVMSREVHACGLGDDVRVALQTMKERRVRRLPVLDGEQRLAEIISLNDVVTGAECRRGADVPGEECVDTLKAICAHSKEPVPA